jgi:hypothetical protein
MAWETRLGSATSPELTSEIAALGSATSPELTSEIAALGSARTQLVVLVTAGFRTRREERR